MEEDNKRVYDRARESKKNRMTEAGRQRNATSTELLHSQVHECSFDKHLGFLVS